MNASSKQSQNQENIPEDAFEEFQGSNAEEWENDVSKEFQNQLKQEMEQNIQRRVDEEDQQEEAQENDTDSQKEYVIDNSSAFNQMSNSDDQLEQQSSDFNKEANFYQKEIQNIAKIGNFSQNKEEIQASQVKDNNQSGNNQQNSQYDNFQDLESYKEQNPSQQNYSDFKEIKDNQVKQPTNQLSQFYLKQNSKPQPQFNPGFQNSLQSQNSKGFVPTNKKIQGNFDIFRNIKIQNNKPESDQKVDVEKPELPRNQPNPSNKTNQNYDLEFQYEELIKIHERERKERAEIQQRLFQREKLLGISRQQCDSANDLKEKLKQENFLLQTEIENLKGDQEFLKQENARLLNQLAVEGSQRGSNVQNFMNQTKSDNDLLTYQLDKVKRENNLLKLKIKDLEKIVLDLQDEVTNTADLIRQKEQVIKDFEFRLEEVLLQKEFIEQKFQAISNNQQLWLEKQEQYQRELMRANQSLDEFRRADDKLVDKHLLLKMQELCEAHEFLKQENEALKEQLDVVESRLLDKQITLQRTIKTSPRPLGQDLLVRQCKDMFREIQRETNTRNEVECIAAVQNLKDQVKEQNQFIDAIRDLIINCNDKRIFENPAWRNQSIMNVRECWRDLKSWFQDYVEIQRSFSKEDKIITHLQNVCCLKFCQDIIPFISEKFSDNEKLTKIVNSILKVLQIDFADNLIETQQQIERELKKKLLHY